MYAKRVLKPNHAKLGDGMTAGKVTVTAYRYKKSTRKWVKVKSARSLSRYYERAPTSGRGDPELAVRTAW